MLKAIVEVSRGKGKTEHLGLGEEGGPLAEREIIETGEFFVLGNWIKSCNHLPTYSRLSQTLKNTGRLRDGRAHNVRVEETGRVLRTFGRGRQSGRVNPREKDQDSGLGQALADTVQGGSSARESSARESGERTPGFVFTTEWQGKR